MGVLRGVWRCAVNGVSRESAAALREGVSSPPQACTTTQGERPSSPYSLISQTRVISTVHGLKLQQCPPAQLYSQVKFQWQLSHAASQAHGEVPEQEEPMIDLYHLLPVVAA